MTMTERTEFRVPPEIFLGPPRPIDDAYARRCLRVLRMAAVLHGKGFHGLRVFPYQYPLAYRIELYPAPFSDRDGVQYLHVDKLQEARLLARHSGAAETSFFDWDDVSTASAEELAVTFIDRFPTLANATYTLDFAYAGWFATLLSHCEYGFLPYLTSEFEPAVGALRMWQVGTSQVAKPMEWFPLPPRPSHGVTFAGDP